MFRFIFFAGWVLLAPYFSYAQGIEFFSGSWKDALKRAEQEDKLIFVDAYASWCGPCKRMAAQVFTDSKAGAFYNGSFINLKIDMEKPEHADFAGKYPVSSYPTLLFIDPTGKVVLKDVGFKEVSPLIEIGKKALGKRSNLLELEQQYDAGLRDPGFMLKYITALNRNSRTSLKVTNEYLSTQTDLRTELNLKIILEGAVEADSRVFDLLLQYYEPIQNLSGKQVVRDRAEQACKATVQKAVTFKDAGLLEEAKKKMAKVDPVNSAKFGYDSDLAFYSAVKDEASYLKVAKQYQKSMVGSKAAPLHELVNTIIRAFPASPRVLFQAEKWAKVAADNGGLAEYYLTLANLYKQNGKKDKARQSILKGLEILGDKDGMLKSRLNFFLESLG
jgi:thiol-disulfide isomerase/thioredoxin